WLSGVVAADARRTGVGEVDRPVSYFADGPALRRYRGVRAGVVGSGAPAFAMGNRLAPCHAQLEDGYAKRWAAYRCFTELGARRTTAYPGAGRKPGPTLWI